MRWELPSRREHFHLRRVSPQLHCTRTSLHYQHQVNHGQHTYIHTSRVSPGKWLDQQSVCEHDLGLHILSCSTLHCTGIAFRWWRHSLAKQKELEEEEDSDTHTHNCSPWWVNQGVFHVDVHWLCRQECVNMCIGWWCVRECVRACVRAHPF